MDPNHTVSLKDISLDDIHGAHLATVDLIWLEVFARDVYCLEELCASGFTPPIIWDVGGNAGLFSRAAQLLWPRAEIHAWEPNPVLVDAFRANAPTANLHHCACALSPGERSLCVEPSNNGGSYLEFVTGDSHEKFTANKILVPCEVAWEVAPHPNFLKIDCEGFEYAFLSKMTCRPEVIVVELHGPRAAHPANVLNSLRPEYLWEDIRQDCSCLPLFRGRLSDL